VKRRHLPARHGEIDLELVRHLAHPRGAEPVERREGHEPTGHAAEGGPSLEVTAQRAELTQLVEEGAAVSGV
jgi:hypothetical protein